MPHRTERTPTQNRPAAVRRAEDPSPTERSLTRDTLAQERAQTNVDFDRDFAELSTQERFARETSMAARATRAIRRHRTPPPSVTEDSAAAQPSTPPRPLRHTGRSGSGQSHTPFGHAMRLSPTELRQQGIASPHPNPLGSNHPGPLSSNPPRIHLPVRQATLLSDGVNFATGTSAGGQQVWLPGLGPRLADRAGPRLNNGIGPPLTNGIDSDEEVFEDGSNTRRALMAAAANALHRNEEDLYRGGPVRSPPGGSQPVDAPLTEARGDSEATLVQSSDEMSDLDWEEGEEGEPAVGNESAEPSNLPRDQRRDDSEGGAEGTVGGNRVGDAAGGNGTGSEGQGQGSSGGTARGIASDETSGNPAEAAATSDQIDELRDELDLAINTYESIRRGYTDHCHLIHDASRKVRHILCEGILDEERRLPWLPARILGTGYDYESERGLGLWLSLHGAELQMLQTRVYAASAIPMHLISCVRDVLQDFDRLDAWLMGLEVGKLELENFLHASREPAGSVEGDGQDRLIAWQYRLELGYVIEGLPVFVGGDGWYT
ncbi:Chaperone protein dnaJ 49 [Sphaceloma murrayae]|uniref:Chaperone protein dnaJ 49 n=1 Tax=Sphaceloma murrayae TaxID=2082308 RepID=A0A2K1QVM5_9PEZI|nr:Chaperone protein dnaJ 49 [Sphaceloma murrayae]